METGEIFLTMYGSTTEIVMGPLSRESEPKRLRSKISQMKIGQRMKTGLRAFKS